MIELLCVPENKRLSQKHRSVTPTIVLYVCQFYKILQRLNKAIFLNVCHFKYYKIL